MYVDHVVIGAGPSGLACALRLALSGMKVALIEKHTVIGGLNSYYRRNMNVDGKKIVLDLDVGLHAITNYTDGKTRSSTLAKLIRSLRISKENLNLSEQNFSFIRLGNKTLCFTNDISKLSESVADLYPHCLKQWQQFLSFLVEYNEFNPNQQNFLSAKMELQKFFSDHEFIHHILFPVLTYGSPWEEDMDFNLFICLFRSMFLEGLCRPAEGIRAWWHEIYQQLKNLEVEILLGEEVQEIQTQDQTIIGIKTNKREIRCQNIFSSAGMIETQKFLPHGGQSQDLSKHVSKLGFVELLLVFDQDLSKIEKLPTLAFCADHLDRYYLATNKHVDTEMAIYCIPSRYQGTQQHTHGMIRMTCITSPTFWFNLSAEDYQKEKIIVTELMLKKLHQEFAHLIDLKNAKLLFRDLFTPKTIHKYTSHVQGSLYGSTLKIKDAKMEYQGLYCIGADQGYPGIVGAMLSGVSIANQYGIMPTLSQVQL